MIPSPQYMQSQKPLPHTESGPSLSWKNSYRKVTGPACTNCSFGICKCASFLGLMHVQRFDTSSTDGNFFSPSLFIEKLVQELGGVSGLAPDNSLPCSNRVKNEHGSSFLRFQQFSTPVGGLVPVFGAMMLPNLGWCRCTGCPSHVIAGINCPRRCPRCRTRRRYLMTRGYLHVPWNA